MHVTTLKNQRNDSVW